MAVVEGVNILYFGRATLDPIFRALPPPALGLGVAGSKVHFDLLLVEPQLCAKFQLRRSNGLGAIGKHAYTHTLAFIYFFTPIPCTYTSLPLDGMAKNYYCFFYMDTQDHVIYHAWIHFIPTSLYPRRERTIWYELGSNPGPHASQATALTTKPWLLGPWIAVLK